jgi:hypothetical protein
MDRAKIVDYYMQKINDKDFNIHLLRQEMEKNNMDENEIKVIVRLVDNEVQRRARLGTENDKARQLIMFGGTIAVLSGAVTVLTYLGIINLGNYYVIAYGPFLGGLSFLFVGLAKRRR